MAVVLGKILYNFTWRRRLHVTTEHSFRAWSSWIGILVSLWVLAWIVANVIPIFGQLLGLIGALFGTWFALGFCSMLWLGLNRGRYGENWRKMALTGVNTSIILVCAACVSVLPSFCWSPFSAKDLKLSRKAVSLPFLPRQPEILPLVSISADENAAVYCRNIWINYGDYCCGRRRQAVLLQELKSTIGSEESQGSDRDLLCSRCASR